MRMGATVEADGQIEGVVLLRQGYGGLMVLDMMVWGDPWGDPGMKEVL